LSITRVAPKTLTEAESERQLYILHLEAVARSRIITSYKAVMDIGAPACRQAEKQKP
jgi:hypothetical protein